MHVAVLGQPPIIFFEHDGTAQPVILPSFGKIPTTSARRLTPLLRRSSGLVECNAERCWAGKVMQASTSCSLSSISAASFDPLIGPRLVCPSSEILGQRAMPRK